MLPAAYDVRHGRAVFHFLTVPEQRAAYVRQAARSVKSGGHVIVSTFGSEGPTKSSGLDVLRYDAESLHSEFGSRVRLVAANDGDMPTLLSLIVDSRATTLRIELSRLQKRLNYGFGVQ